MKKIISILLSAVILIGAISVGFTVFAADEELNIAIASDLHYNEPRETLEGDIDHEIYWYANRRAAMEDESGFIIDEMLRQVAESDSEFLLISGDLADNGRRIAQEHYDVAAKLKKFEEESGKSVFVIPGNHDFGAGEEDFKINDFVTTYADFGYDKAIEKIEGTGSYTANLGEK